MSESKSVIDFIDAALEAKAITINDLIEYVFDDMEFLIDNISPCSKGILNDAVKLLWEYQYAQSNNN